MSDQHGPLPGTPPGDVPDSHWKYLDQDAQAAAESQLSAWLDDSRQVGDDGAKLAVEALLILSIQELVLWWFSLVVARKRAQVPENSADFGDYIKKIRWDAADEARQLRDHLKTEIIGQQTYRIALSGLAAEWAMAKGARGMQDLVCRCANTVCIVVLALRVEDCCKGRTATSHQILASPEATGARRLGESTKDPDGPIILRAMSRALLPGLINIHPWLRDLIGMKHKKDPDEIPDFGYKCINVLLTGLIRKFQYRSAAEAYSFFVNEIRYLVKQERKDAQQEPTIEIKDESEANPSPEDVKSFEELHRRLWLWLKIKGFYAKDGKDDEAGLSEAVRLWVVLVMREKYRLQWSEIAEVLTNSNSHVLTELDLPPSCHWTTVIDAFRDRKVTTNAIKRCYLRELKKIVTILPPSGGLGPYPSLPDRA